MGIATNSSRFSYVFCHVLSMTVFLKQETPMIAVEFGFNCD